MQGMAKPSATPTPFPTPGLKKPYPNKQMGRPAGPKPPAPPTPTGRPMPMLGKPNAMPKMPKNPGMSGTIGTQVQQPADSRLQIMDSLKRAFQKGKSKPQYFGGGQ